MISQVSFRSTRSKSTRWSGLLVPAKRGDTESKVRQSRSVRVTRDKTGRCFLYQGASPETDGKGSVAGVSACGVMEEADDRTRDVGTTTDPTSSLSCL